MTTIEVPDSIALSDEDAKAFQTIIVRQQTASAKMKAVAEYRAASLQQIQTACEQRMAELHVEGAKIGDDLKALWAKLKQQHGLDLDKFDHDLSDDGKSLIVKHVKVAP